MIDLHVHTKYSDGRLEVEEILKRAKRQGITTISFCVHNVLGAYEELSHIDCKFYNIDIITGIECLHTRHILEQVEYIESFCKENNLKISGGSDFHRDGKQTLGYGVKGTLPITERYCLKRI